MSDPQQTLPDELARLRRTVRAHTGEGELYRLIDEAMGTVNWERIAVITRVFRRLDPAAQRSILENRDDPDTVLTALRRLHRQVKVATGPASRSA